MTNIIITINRECGSGGGEIARHYNFVLNVTGLEPDTVAAFLADNVRLKLQADMKK